MSKAAALLLVVGLVQMVGDLVHLPAVKAMGAATCASPAPKVFTSVRGLETFSTRFFIEWDGQDSKTHSLPLTPEIYARLQGPYSRRNVYGAVLAFGPILVMDPKTRPMFDSVARFALCGEAPVLREIGVDPTGIRGRVRVRLEPRPGTRIGDLALAFEAPCE